MDHQGSDKAQFDLVVGLSYEPTASTAPSISLKGSAEDSSWILSQAQRFGVPIVEDRDVASTLAELPLDQEIPEALYKAIAVILNRLG